VRDDAKVITARVYFDWNATAPLRPEARAAMLAALDAPQNASSVHAEGRTARGIVEEARRKVAALAGAEPSNVIFTSGATEANMLALTPALGGVPRRERLFVSAIEHPSVRSGGRFAADVIEEVSVTATGVIDLDALKQTLTRFEHPLVSVMLANNETGVVQPIRAVAELVHAAGGILHVDAVQGAGRMPVDMAALGADLLSLSSHKIGGPQGAGALIRRTGLSPEPLIKGGGQERGFRAGTENVAAIAGFGAAAVPRGNGTSIRNPLYRLSGVDPSKLWFEFSPHDHSAHRAARRSHRGRLYFNGACRGPERTQISGLSDSRHQSGRGGESRAPIRCTQRV